MAEYAGVNLSGAIEAGKCDHPGVELLIKQTGLLVAEIEPSPGTRNTPFMLLVLRVTEDNSGG